MLTDVLRRLISAVPRIGASLSGGSARKFTIWKGDGTYMRLGKITFDSSVGLCN